MSKIQRKFVESCLLILLLLTLFLLASLSATAEELTKLQGFGGRLPAKANQLR